MECKNCGANVGIEYRLCPYCHSEIEYPNDEQPIIIQNIYNTPPPNQQYPNNQVHYPQQYYPVYCSSKSKVIAITMCIIFGWLGVHRFYVGKIGTGILYALTFGLFGIGWIYDTVKICTNTFTDALGLPVIKQEPNL